MQMNHYSIDSFANYEDAYTASTEHPEKFWEGIAHEFVWQKPWDKTLEWEFNTPNVKWFQGGVLNITRDFLKFMGFSTSTRIRQILYGGVVTCFSLLYTSGFYRL